MKSTDFVVDERIPSEWYIELLFEYLRKLPTEYKEKDYKKLYDELPGDYYDLGTLNPIGRKKAKNEAEDEAADAAGPFVPAITINGEKVKEDVKINEVVIIKKGKNKFVIVR